MKKLESIGLNDVQAVYSGPEGDLWELIMGQQIHIAGFQSSLDLAEKANIMPGTKGVDFCACNGAGMRFLVLHRQVGHMTGVDATPTVVERGRARCAQEGFDGKIDFVLADVTASGLPSDSFDFAWGEDAWCYVVDKPKLIAEAARVVKKGGCIAFTDWVEGPGGLTDAEAERFMTFMKFPTYPTVDEYTQLLKANGCEVKHASDTGRFAPCIDLYLNMLNTQLTSDALRIIGNNADMMKALAGEMLFAQQLAHEHKIIQGLFVAEKK